MIGKYSLAVDAPAFAAFFAAFPAIQFYNAEASRTLFVLLSRRQCSATL